MDAIPGERCVALEVPVPTNRLLYNGFVSQPRNRTAILHSLTTVGKLGCFKLLSKQIEPRTKRQ